MVSIEVSLSDKEIGIIYDGLEGLHDHYNKMCEKEIKETLSGDYINYLNDVKSILLKFSTLIDITNKM